MGQETINKLKKQLENSQGELHKKMKAEEDANGSRRKVQEISLAYAELRKRYLESIKEW